MLRELNIERFKCFETLALPMRRLTLLTGTNGGGKSSIIQSLVLLSQTLSEREWGSTLLLEGPELALGSAGDVLNQRSARKQLSLGAKTSGESVVWSFKAGDRRALSLELESVHIDGREVPLAMPMRWLLPADRAEGSCVVKMLRRLSWVTAERTGPRELLPLRDADGHAQVGARGELAAGLLYWKEAETIEPRLCIEGVPPTLFHQVRARMQEFFPGCDLRVSAIDGASAVSLRLRSDSKSDFQRPQNVGFGLTQLFPIVVALLSAERDSLLLLENPEVHLHPRAQQKIGTLISLVAATGVQVVVETHSDHVLNGIRLAVKRKVLAPDDTAVHFFAPNVTEGELVPISPTMDLDGRLSNWPEGFFDQFDLALSELM